MFGFRRNRRLAIKVVGVLLLFLVIFALFLLWYITLPEDSSLRTKLHLGSKLKFLEFAHYFYDYRKLGIPIYDLEIGRKNLQELYENVPASENVFVGDEYKVPVPAKFFYNGQDFDVKARFRGLWASHWVSAKKSWRIKFKSDELLEGKRQINLIEPADRCHIVALLDNYIAGKMGLLAPDIRYVFLRLNGRLQGLYLEIEKPAKELLARKLKTDSANLYTDDLFGFWLQANKCPEIYQDTCFWKKDAMEEVSGIENYADLDYLLTLINNPDDTAFYRQIEYILDTEKFLRWQAVSMMEASFHSNQGVNGMLYFDPIVGRFEPLVWDVHQWRFDETAFMDKAYHPLVTRLLQKAEYLHRRNCILWDYVNSAQNLQDDLKFYDEQFKRVKKAYYADRNKEYSNWGLNQDIRTQRQNIIANRDKIKADLSFSELLVKIRLSPPAAASGAVLAAMDITSIGFSAARLKGITMALTEELPGRKDVFALYYDADNSQDLNAGDSQIGQFLYRSSGQLFFAGVDKIIYPGRDSNLQPQPRTYRFFVVTAAAAPAAVQPARMELEAVNAVTGQRIEPRYRYIGAADFARFPEITEDVQQFLLRYPFFEREGTDGKVLTLSGKTLDIAQTIIVPRGVMFKIGPGTTLRFGSGVSLISYSPLLIQGQKEAPVIFTALDPQKRWGVAAVVNTGGLLSKIENAVLEYGGEHFINGIYFSGTLAAHNAPVEIRDCIFRHCQGDDALNVKSTTADVTDCYFGENASDAVDFDFAEGRITNCYFAYNQGDSIDLCGSSPEIKGNFIEHSADKGMSIGEESRPRVFNNVIRNCNIGIADKDMSYPVIINNVIVDNEAGIAAYIKKTVFGKAEGLIKNTIIWGNKTQIEQDEISTLSFSNCLIEGGYNKGGEDIISRKPIFVNPQEKDYTLKACEDNLLLDNAAIGLSEQIALPEWIKNIKKED